MICIKTIFDLHNQTLECAITIQLCTEQLHDGNSVPKISVKFKAKVPHRVLLVIILLSLVAI
jgi:hypothetical protein